MDRKITEIWLVETWEPLYKSRTVQSQIKAELAEWSDELIQNLKEKIRNK